MRKLYSGTPAGTSLGRDPGGTVDTGVPGGGGIAVAAAGLGAGVFAGGPERFLLVLRKSDVKGIVGGIGLTSCTLWRWRLCGGTLWRWRRLCGTLRGRVGGSLWRCMRGTI